MASLGCISWVLMVSCQASKAAAKAEAVMDEAERTTASAGEVGMVGTDDLVQEPKAITEASTFLNQ